MDESFEMLRGERRSFFCPNKLWAELKKQTNDCMSVSQYVRMAVIEKMKRNNEGMEEYLDELLR
jgi:hypothetical protein